MMFDGEIKQDSDNSSSDESSSLCSSSASKNHPVYEQPLIGSNDELAQ
jgi:hypothetical protein